MNLPYLHDRSELEQRSKQGARAVYLGSGAVICRVLDKFKLYVDTNDNGIVPHLMLDGFWESWVTSAMARLVQPGWYVVNVGANFGYYSVLFGELVGEHGRVLAFEPQRDVAEHLKASMQINGFAHYSSVSTLAVGRRSGVADVVLEDSRFKNATVEFCEHDPIDTATRENRVEVVSLDDAVTKDFNRDPDLVFIDAEGSEQAIWAGMERIRKRPGVHIVMEFTPSKYTDPRGFVEEMRRDFVVGRILPTGGIAPASTELLVNRPTNEPFEMILLTKR